MARKEFTKPVKRDALKRSAGLCEASGTLYGLDNGKRCNAPLAGGVEFDHIVRACDGGDNSLENCAAVCKRCHGHKTAAFDTPQAAKTKRMSDKSAGIKTAPQKPLQGRPFPKTDKPKTHRPSLPPRRMYAPVGALWPQPKPDWNEDRNGD